MKWTKIEDEEPEGEVLAVGYQNEMLFGYVAYKDKKYGWVCESSDEWVSEVTHWMKPELPNELNTEKIIMARND